MWKVARCYRIGTGGRAGGTGEVVVVVVVVCGGGGGGGSLSLYLHHFQVSQGLSQDRAAAPQQQSAHVSTHGRAVARLRGQSARSGRTREKPHLLQLLLHPFLVAPEPLDVELRDLVGAAPVQRVVRTLNAFLAIRII